MLEITHRSFVSYTLPSTGQVIPMLQITPSKTDKERLLVISPERAVALLNKVITSGGDLAAIKQAVAIVAGALARAG